MPAVWTLPATASVGQLTIASWLNTYLRDNLLFLQASNGLLPAGIIAMYGDQAANIPSVGWHQNDGAGGTVDLRDRFVVGAGSTYSPGAGASGTPTLTEGAHGSHTIGQSSAHASHTITQPDHPINDITFTGGSFSPFINTVSHNGSLDAHSAHSGMDLDAHSVHSAVSLLPPYLARAFMQRIASGLSSTTPRTWTTGDVPTAAMMNADYRDNPAYLAAQVLPPNAIAIWSGSIATIPSPYQLCQGGATQDLRDRFYISALNSYPEGTTGGAASVTIPPHSSHTPSQAGNHSSHIASQPSAHNVGGNNGTSGGGSHIISSGTHTGFAVDAHSAHSGFNVDSHSAHDPLALLPPYIALAFMQMLGSAYSSPKTWTTGEVVRAADINKFGRDNLTSIYQGIPPIGAILKWNSTVVSIPTHWALCNGSGGTPDTRDKFVIGAGLTYAVNATGGATTASISDHAAHVVSQGAAHTAHVVTSPAAHSTNNIAPGGGVLNGTGSHNFTVDNPHSHSGATATGSHSHSVNPVPTTPPYYAYAYIQRTS